MKMKEMVDIFEREVELDKQKADEFTEKATKKLFKERRTVDVAVVRKVCIDTISAALPRLLRVKERKLT